MMPKLTEHVGITIPFCISKKPGEILIFISHNASSMEANIRVLLIHNFSSYSSLDVNGLELPCLTATLCFTRLRNQGNSLMRS